MHIEYLKKIIEIVIPIFAIIAGIWGFFKLFYRFKSKYLLITNCQILHKTIWKDISEVYSIKQNGDQDHAFRPLVLLPCSLKKYSNIKNGNKAVLESINPNNGNNLKTIAEVYWIPEGMNKWNKIIHPVFSLVLRRYFCMERPMYQDEKTVKGDWQIVKHHIKHLDPLNRYLNDTHLQWAISDSYSYRYFNPEEGEKGTYSPEPGPNSFIEYCGLSIIMRTYSFFRIEKDNG